MTQSMNADLVSESPVTILVVDDDVEMCDLFSNVLGELGFAVSTAFDGKSALDLMKTTAFDIAIFDIRMPGVDGLTLLEEARRIGSPAHVIILTGHGTSALADQAMKLGAYDFITKPFDLNEIQKIIGRIVQTGLHVRHAEVLFGKGKESYVFDGIVSHHPSMHQVFEVIKKVAQSKCTVLIQGESGTGKELVARAVHARSNDADKAFMPIDCGSINENLIESELFGHEKGAFTGAYIEKQGLFRVASGGTIFLDEISEIPVEVQAKLLRTLQEKRVRPLGSARFYVVDARVIAATNKDLHTAIKHGAFREDLFFRLNVVPIAVPPLRERKEDIPLLVNHFIEKYQRYDQPVRGVSQNAMKLLLRYEWPGNVRQLENAIQRALALGESDTITEQDLPPLTPQESGGGTDTAQRSQPRTLAEIERDAIERTLEETGGDKAAAARILGVNKSTLYRKLQKYSIRES